MTKEEAIKEIKYVKDKTGYADKALDMAIKALEFDLDKHDEEVIKNTVESIWGEPCEDCISRKAMHIELEKWITYGEYKFSNATKYLYDRIDNLPPVYPEQRVGWWIDEGAADNNGNRTRLCSRCQHRDVQAEDVTVPYCRFCGAKMESEEV